jgi:AhpD family alkylhydroperoxidase
MAAPQTLDSVEWGESFLEPRRDSELEREVREAVGRPLFTGIRSAVRLLAPCPWLARGLGTANHHNGKLVMHVEDDLADLVFLVVSQDNSCRYCYQGQRTLLRVMGFDEQRIRAVEDASLEADTAEQLALDFARRISRANPPPSAADWDALRAAGFSGDAIKELVSLATYTVAANRTTTLAAMPLANVEGLDNLFFRLLRPAFAWAIRRGSTRGQATFLPPELKEGPFAYAALPLDGLPVALVERQRVEDAWTSPILTQRAKALIFAVIARGLGSQKAEAEARRLLAPLGLDDGEVDEILAHLSSSKLDAIESMVVPFARETIRVRPADIQRRARELREQLSVEQFLEVVGVVAVANSTCRLSLVLCEAG